MRVPAIGAARSAVYRSAMDQCAWADRLGFYAVYLGEHHGAEDGYIPSPIVCAAAIAQATSQIKIHLAALATPLHNPVRLAEDLAVLDLISNARLRATLGLGYVPAEYPMLGINQSDRVRLLVETVEMLPKAWSGEPFEFRGNTIRVRPQPVSPGGPPIFLHAGTEAGARRAARLGVPIDVRTTTAGVEAYEAELTRLGRPVPPRPPGSLHDLQFVYVTDDPDRDWPLITPYLLEYNNSYASFQVHRAQDQRNWRPVTEMAVLQADPRYNVWTPAEFLEQLRALGPDDEYVIQPLVGGMPAELSWPSLCRIESDVLPKLDLTSS
jgi:alkanesulfonate monooxygenase SsuD/methylene tetrahydromethanopterin reductase-like flavin-dependent oxidoreductase (luciferase family)